MGWDGIELVDGILGMIPWRWALALFYFLSFRLKVHRDLFQDSRYGTRIES